MSVPMPQLPAAVTVTVDTAAHTLANTPHSSHASGGAIALAALGVVLVLACAAWAATRMLALEPHWTLSLRHAAAEAGVRLSATWAELGDWARLGR
jgi:predicted acyltransferase